jgi:hypothetical protein
MGKLYTEKLHGVKFLNAIILIKLRKKMLTGFLEIWWKNHYGRNHLGYVSVGRRIILKRILINRTKWFGIDISGRGYL